MKGTDLLIAFVLSCTVHAGIFVGASLLQPAEMLYQSGTSAAIYDVEIVSSRSPATAPSPQAVKDDSVLSLTPSGHRPLKKALPQKPSVLDRTSASESAESAGSYSGVQGPIAVRGLTKPQYPAFAREHGIEGRVVLKAFIAESGTVTRVETLQSSGHDILDSSALKALREAEFIPATLDKKPISSTKTISFRFSLQDN